MLFQKGLVATFWWRFSAATRGDGRRWLNEAIGSSHEPMKPRPHPGRSLTAAWRRHFQSFSLFKQACLAISTSRERLSFTTPLIGKDTKNWVATQESECELERLDIPPWVPPFSSLWAERRTNLTYNRLKVIQRSSILMRLAWLAAATATEK